jgi:hypothetical protein
MERRREETDRQHRLPVRHASRQRVHRAQACAMKIVRLIRIAIRLIIARDARPCARSKMPQHLPMTCELRRAGLCTLCVIAAGPWLAGHGALRLRLRDLRRR